MVETWHLEIERYKKVSEKRCPAREEEKNEVHILQNVNRHEDGEKHF
jgi:hypothetical protein